jgi:hypothetical protein
MLYIYWFNLIDVLCVVIVANVIKLQQDIIHIFTTTHLGVIKQSVVGHIQGYQIFLSTYKIP